MEITHTQKKLFGLDHLRSLAILLVLIYHYGILFSGPEALRTYGKFGWTGVDLFFVLSGYLIVVDLGYGCLVMGAVSANSFLYKIKSGFSTKLAELSYALYLTHKFGNNITQKFLIRFDIPKSSWLMFLLCMISCLLIALLLNLLIEKPFMQLRDYLLKRNTLPERIKLIW